MRVQNPFLNAREASEASRNAIKAHQSKQISDIKNELDAEIRHAIRQGRQQVTVHIPHEVDPLLVDALVRVLRKMGYTAKVEVREGVLGVGSYSAYIAPSTALTVGWGHK